MAALCARYWKSTILAVLVLTSDLLCLFGGTPGAPIFEEFYWLLLSREGGLLALWNSHLRQSLQALGILWMLRGLVLARTILAWAFCKYLVDFHCLRYSGEGERRRRAGHRLLLASVWHLLMGLALVMTFWGAYLPAVVDGEGARGLQSWLRWMVDLVLNKTVGPAPIVVLIALQFDAAAIVMAFVYQRRQGAMQKLNANIPHYFDGSNHHPHSMA